MQRPLKTKAINNTNFKNILLLLMLCCSSTYLFATKYYVNATTGNDNNNGLTAATAWRSVSKACNMVTANQGHVIELAAGNFNETQTCIIPSGTTIQGAGRKTTIITSSVYPIFKIGTAQNISMHSFTLDGRNKALWQAIKIDDINGFDLYDFYIKEFGYWTNTQPYVYIASISITSASNIKIHDFEGTNASSGHNAMIGLGSGSITNADIYNGNVLNSEQSHGKIVGAGGNKTALNNVKIHDNIFYTASAGAWEIPGSGGIYPPQIVVEFWDVFTTNCEIYNNSFNANVSIQSNGYAYPGDTYKTVRIHHNNWNCDRSTGYQYAIETSNDNNEIDHNYIYGGAYSIASFGEWQAGNPKPLKNINIHHNVFEAQTISTLIVNFDKTNVQNIRFANNTVSAISGNNLIGGNGTLQNFTITNNIFYKNSTATNNLNTGVTIASNLFYNIAPKGSLSISGNPNFTAAGNKPSPFFTLNPGSPAIDAGVPIAGITDGYTGAKPDIGAYEAGTIPWTAGPGAFVSGPVVFNIPATIEAEKAELSNGAAFNNNHTNYTGTGFVDKYITPGPKTLFRVKAPNAGAYIFTLRYSREITASALSIYVNGVKIKQTQLAPTPNWESWTTKSETLTLNVGINTVAYTYDASDGGNVNLDNIAVTAFTATPLKLEAENATLNAVTIITNGTASGGKITGNMNTTGSYLQWKNVPAGTKLDVVYNGPATTKSIYINGTKVAAISLPVAAGGTFLTASININIPANATLKIQRDATDYNWTNFDYVQISTPAAARIASNPVAVKIATVDGNIALKLSPNPAKEVVTVEYNSSVRQLTHISMTNQSGQMIKSLQQQAVTGKNRISIPLNVIPGVYYISVKKGNKTDTQKLAVE